MLTVALGMMLCLPLRLINYRDCALMGNDSQQSKPNHHVSEGYNEELVLHMALCGLLACAYRLIINCVTIVKLLD